MSRRLGAQRRPEPRTQRRHHRSVAAVRAADGRATSVVQPRHGAAASRRDDRPTRRSSAAARSSCTPTSRTSIRYAGGALHYICEAINPWLDRPLAATRRRPAGHRRRADLRAAPRPRGRDRRRLVRRALLHRQGGRRLHAPHPDWRATGCSSCRDALVLHHSQAARRVALLLSDPQPLAFHPEELSDRHDHRHHPPLPASTSRCSCSSSSRRATG